MWLKWYDVPSQDPEDWDDQILKKQRRFKLFRFSIYELNRVSSPHTILPITDSCFSLH